MVAWFWEIIREFSPERQGQFLKFVTSCSRQPLLGFGSIEPPLCVQKVRIDDDPDRLPTSATCMNLLKLPEYPTKALMREKLEYAITSASGFELS